MARRGPNPLPVHLGLAASTSSDMRGGEGNYTMQDIVQGIQMYQAHEYCAPKPSYERVLSNDYFSIYRPSGTASISNNAPILLLVPSLINKANILDIHPQRSLLRWYAAQGIDALLLEWKSTSDSAMREVEIETLSKVILAQAIKGIADKTKQKVNVLGYCLGGTVFMGACEEVTDHVGRIILLATPWDFHDPSMRIAKAARVWTPALKHSFDAREFISAEWVQTLFASASSQVTAQKFAKFAKMDQTSFEAELFIAVEDWLNDGVDLPRNIAQYCIQNWMIENQTVKGSWIDAENITHKMLIVASDKDDIVPFSCADAARLHFNKASVDVHKKSCGHVSLIAGRHAIKEVWQPMLDWLVKK